MKRPYVLIAAGLLALGIVFDWRLTRAHDGDQPVSALEPVLRPQQAGQREQPASALHPERRDENSVICDLVERLDAMEKRLAAIEDRQTLVRQADSRETAVDYQTTEPLYSPNSANKDQDVANDNGTQNTNGQKWHFRLLTNKNR